MIKLSIIIPYYKTYELTKELVDILKPQLTKDVEVIIVDDGCNETRLDETGFKVIHLEKNSGNASKPRNVGLDNANGEYVAFIDSDDKVSSRYIEKILKTIKGEPDIIFLSWQSRVQKVVMNMYPPKWNCAVWCRVYKRSIIGNTRFDENLRIAEDWKFNQQIKFYSKLCIKDIIYYYNNGREGSLING